MLSISNSSNTLDGRAVDLHSDSELLFGEKATTADDPIGRCRLLLERCWLMVQELKTSIREVLKPRGSNGIREYFEVRDVVSDQSFV